MFTQSAVIIFVGTNIDSCGPFKGWKTISSEGRDNVPLFLEQHVDTRLTPSSSRARSIPHHRPDFGQRTVTNAIDAHLHRR